MALLLAPSTPSTLSIRILQIYKSPELNSIFIASSLALVQVFVILILILFWFFLEKIINQKFFFLFLIKTLPRKKSFIEKCLFTIGVFLILLSIIGIVNSLFWGLGDSWYFPNIFPDKYTLIHIATFYMKINL